MTTSQNAVLPKACTKTPVGRTSKGEELYCSFDSCQIWQKTDHSVSVMVGEVVVVVVNAFAVVSFVVAVPCTRILFLEDQAETAGLDFRQDWT